MRKTLRYSLLGVIVLLLLIQFVPVDRSNPPTDEAMAIKAPAEIQAIIEKSCYDCHSHKTEWPFYSYIAPISWLVAGDVTEGREHLNFSQWYQMPAQRQARLKDEIVEEVMKGEMPLSIYLITHSGAKLSDQQKQELKSWAEAPGEE